MFEFPEPSSSRAWTGSQVFRVKVQSSFHWPKAPYLSWRQLAPGLGVLPLSLDQEMSFHQGHGFLFLFFLVCLKYFIILKCAKIKRLCGKLRLPVWIWALDTQTQTKGRCHQSCLNEEFCCLGSPWQTRATSEHFNGHG